MSRDKHIEEMENIIICHAEKLPRCPHTTCSICKATELYTAGYRLATKVAEEIFAEIEKCFFEELVGQTEAKLLDEEMFAELKKKYTKS